ncbi:hypothetical protein PMAYCL1PPCAC_20573 [Pristionchus mayeri]|uniref:Smr domain-containing protein n=1 Tax=Pristionchus mayeri TaxID=1317129 RepID=A0AAN5CTD2_9BILA|nr:hypothetical protein PMAYCL1PPCAC_20573 [Pristionchus mayeri]
MPVPNGAYSRVAANFRPKQPALPQPPRAPKKKNPLPTRVAYNDQLTALGDMAARNGCAMTYSEVKKKVLGLHNERKTAWRNLDFEIAKDKEKEIRDEVVKWNGYLNGDVLDLHWLLATQAIAFLKERIELVKKSGKQLNELHVITGAGHNSEDNKPTINSAVRLYLTEKNIRFYVTNPGCYTIGDASRTLKGFTL